MNEEELLSRQEFQSWRENDFKHLVKKVQEHWPGYIPRRYRDMGDGSFAERQVAAVEDASGQRINPAREDGNLASILARLDMTLSALRDALRGTGNRDFTTLEADVEGILGGLDVALSTRAAAAQLPGALSPAGNLKQSVEEAAIAMPADIQARYSVKSTRDIAPSAVGTFWLPETGSIDLSDLLASSWYVYAPATATMVIDVYLQVSHDGGATFHRAAGYSIADADFVRDQWNSIHCPLMLAQAKLEVVIAAAYPSELKLMVIRKA
jgi:hypothetical protein